METLPCPVTSKTMTTPRIDILRKIQTTFQPGKSVTHQDGYQSNNKVSLAPAGAWGKGNTPHEYKNKQTTEWRYSHRKVIMTTSTKTKTAKASATTVIEPVVVITLAVININKTAKGAYVRFFTNSQGIQFETFLLDSVIAQLGGISRGTQLGLTQLPTVAINPEGNEYEIEYTWTDKQSGEVREHAFPRLQVVLNLENVQITDPVRKIGSPVSA